MQSVASGGGAYKGSIETHPNVNGIVRFYLDTPRRGQDRWASLLAEGRTCRRRNWVVHSTTKIAQARCAPDWVCTEKGNAL